MVPLDPGWPTDFYWWILHNLITMNWQIRIGTANAKLGPGATVVTLDRKSCPSSCPLKGAGCYAESGPIRLSWDRVSRGEAKDDGRTRFTGRGFTDLSMALRSLAPRIPRGSVVRIGDAGDPSHNGRVPLTLIRALGYLREARGVRPIVYTHSRPLLNEEAIEEASRQGFALNFSVHHLNSCGRTATQGGERVLTVSPDFWDGDTLDVLRCPAETREVTCSDCGLCSRRRGYPIGFTAHGTRKALVTAQGRIG